MAAFIVIGFYSYTVFKSVDIKSTNSSINSFDRHERPKKKKCLKIAAIIISIVVVLTVVFIIHKKCRSKSSDIDFEEKGKLVNTITDDN